MKYNPEIDLDTAPEGSLLLVCMREVNVTHRRDGDAIRACQHCLRPVRVAPTSQALLADAEKRGRLIRVKCIECAEHTLMRPDTQFGFAPGAAEEIIRRTGGK